MSKRLLGTFAGGLLVAAALVACGGGVVTTTHVACAATMDSDYMVVQPAAMAPPKPVTTNSPKANVPPSPTGQNGAARTTTVAPTPTVPKVTGTSGAGSIPPPPTGTKQYTVPGEKAYTPPQNTTQPAADLSAAKNSLQSGQQLSMDTSRGYTSPVTHHVYVYHDATYFNRAGFHDPYDPYDPYNLTNVFSPWYGYHFAMVAHC